MPQPQETTNLTLTADERELILKYTSKVLALNRRIKAAKSEKEGYVVDLTLEEIAKISDSILVVTNRRLIGLQEKLDRLFLRLEEILRERGYRETVAREASIDMLRIGIRLWLERLTGRRPMIATLGPEAGTQRQTSKGIFFCSLDNNPAPAEPIVTAAFYGPDDGRATKLVLAAAEGEVMSRWLAKNVLEDKTIFREARKFLSTHAAKGLTATGGTIGCPHEEDIDFPQGLDCSKCPAWCGRQGGARQQMS